MIADNTMGFVNKQFEKMTLKEIRENLMLSFWQWRNFLLHKKVENESRSDFFYIHELLGKIWNFENVRDRLIDYENNLCELLNGNKQLIKCQILLAVYENEKIKKSV